MCRLTDEQQSYSGKVADRGPTLSAEDGLSTADGLPGRSSISA